MTVLVLLTVGCAGSSGDGESSPESTTTVTATPTATVTVTASPEASASPETSATGASPEPPAPGEAGLVVAKCKDGSVRSLFLAPRDSDQPSLVYLAEFADLCTWDDLPTPLANTGVWRVEVGEEVWDQCQIHRGYWEFDRYENSACQ